MTTIQLKSCTPAHFPKDTKTYSHKNLYIYTNFICSNSKLEITQMFFNWSLRKQTVVHLYHRKLLSNKKETDLLSHNILGESSDNYAE